MERWSGRVVLVTGASSGIGAGICKELVKHGMTVIGCARDGIKLKEVFGSDPISSSVGEMHVFRCDLSMDMEILALFDNIRNQFGRLDVIINNAGINTDSPLLKADASAWRNILEVNVIALSTCTREAFKIMEEKDIKDGQIINIGSVVGKKIPEASLPGFNFYSATKSMVRILTEGVRMEVRKTKIPNVRVASITPGAVETGFFAKSTKNEEMAQKFYSAFQCLKPEDIAEAVMYILGAPQRVEINDITVQPVEYTM